MMRGLRSTAALLIAGSTLAACTAAPGSPPPDRAPAGAPDVELVAFDSCGSALRELKRAVLPLVGPYGLPPDPRMFDGAEMATAAPMAADGAERAAALPQHSTTNVHESAADEPDLVKTDGKRLVTVVDRKLRVIDVASRKVTTTLDLHDEAASGLLIDGDKALVMVPGEGRVDREGKPMTPAGSLRLLQVDLTRGEITGELTVAGSLVDARATDGTARVVISSSPRLKFSHPVGRRTEAEQTKRNRAIVRRSTLDDWLPEYSLRADGRQESGRLVDCTRISHPEPATASSLLTVLSLDIDGKLAKGDPVSITADGATVYGNGKNLYVADDNLPVGRPIPMLREGDIASPRPQKQRTRIYRFDVGGAGPPRFVASGAVDGGLLNQYSLSEHDGFLRVATTKEDWRRGRRSASAVTVLQRDGDRLVQVGRVGGLGKGERIYAVRFIGDVGYVVTFRQTDPLYRIDLADPRNPRVAGALKITGYSAYLHAVAPDRLLGVGQEADQQGRVQGTQLALFDTSAATPARVARLHIEGGSSDVEHDPHAFLYWPDDNLVVLPVRVWNPEENDEPAASEAVVLRVAGESIERIGTIAHPYIHYGPSDIRRTLVVGDTLWTVSESGVMASDLGDLSRQAWLSFR